VGVQLFSAWIFSAAKVSGWAMISFSAAKIGGWKIILYMKKEAQKCWYVYLSPDIFKYKRENRKENRTGK
jgi:hypothetical protein